jgi:hypothetical protein
MEQRITKNGGKIDLTVNDGKIEIDDNTLIIDKSGLISIIKNNTDKKSREIDNNILKMIRVFYGNFSFKQSQWIVEKVKYIVRHNEKYRNWNKFDDIIFI